MPFALTTATAELRVNTPVAVASWRFEWTPDALWVFAEVTDAVLEGDDRVAFSNDGVELYVAGAPPTDADYGPDDHHYAIDHRGQRIEWSPPTAATMSIVGMTSFVRPTVAGYDVEIRVAAEQLGGVLAASRTLGVDVQLNDQPGQGTLLWTIAPHGPCGACTLGSCCCVPGDEVGDWPYCNALRFGTLHLE